MDEPLLKYEALPNIIITRYEANKKNGFVGIDSDGNVPYLDKYNNRLIVVALDGSTGVSPSYTIDATKALKYDFTLSGGINYISISNLKDGQEIKCIVTNTHGSGTALFSVSSLETLKWYNHEMPLIHQNALITFYKSNNIIYAEIKSHYINSSGSDSGS